MPSTCPGGGVPKSSLLNTCWVLASSQSSAASCLQDAGGFLKVVNVKILDVIIVTIILVSKTVSMALDVFQEVTEAVVLNIVVVAWRSLDPHRSDVLDVKMYTVVLPSSFDWWLTTTEVQQHVATPATITASLLSTS
eukprot:2120378-Amphidinium_carterae.1